MSDTPRTDKAERTADTLGVMDAFEFAIYHGQKLEIELNEANEWIKRIEKFLIEKSNNAEQRYDEERNDGYGESVASSRALYLAFKEALSQFRKAKEDEL